MYFSLSFSFQSYTCLRSCFSFAIFFGAPYSVFVPHIFVIARFLKDIALQVLNGTVRPRSSDTLRLEYMYPLSLHSFIIFPTPSTHRLSPPFFCPFVYTENVRRKVRFFAVSACQWSSHNGGRSTAAAADQDRETLSWSLPSGGSVRGWRAMWTL